MDGLKMRDTKNINAFYNAIKKLNLTVLNFKKASKICF